MDGLLGGFSQRFTTLRITPVILPRGAGHGAKLYANGAAVQEMKKAAAELDFI